MYTKEKYKFASVPWHCRHLALGLCIPQSLGLWFLQIVFSGWWSYPDLLWFVVCTEHAQAASENGSQWTLCWWKSCWLVKGEEFLGVVYVSFIHCHVLTQASWTVKAQAVLGFLPTWARAALLTLPWMLPPTTVTSLCWRCVSHFFLVLNIVFAWFSIPVSAIWKTKGRLVCHPWSPDC